MPLSNAGQVPGCEDPQSRLRQDVLTLLGILATLINSAVILMCLLITVSILTVPAPAVQDVEYMQIALVACGAALVVEFISYSAAIILDSRLHQRFSTAVLLAGLLTLLLHGVYRTPLPDF